VYKQVGGNNLYNLSPMNKIIFAIVVPGLFLLSCENHLNENAITNHEIVNLSDQVIDSLIIYDRSRYNPYKIFEIGIGDTSEVISLQNIGMEIDFEIYNLDARYSSRYSWSLVIDPTDNLKRGCYRYFIVSIDSLNSRASIAGQQIKNCRIIQ